MSGVRRLLQLRLARQSLGTDRRHRYTRTAGTSHDGLLAVHVLQRWTRNGTGHDLTRNSLRGLMQMRRRSLALLLLLLLNRQLLRLLLIACCSVVQLGQTDGLGGLVHLRRLLRQHLATDGRTYRLDQLLLANQMDRLHVGERLRAADFLLLDLDVLLAAMTGSDGLVHHRRWRLARLGLELTNLNGLGRMLSGHSHSLLLLRSRLSRTVLLGWRRRLYRALVDDLRTTLQNGRVSRWNLMVPGWYFASLYDDLLWLGLGLTNG